MTLWTMAWRGISRQAFRFLLFFLGLTITVSGVLIPIFLATSMERVLGDNFDVVGANILVLPPKGH